MKKFILIILMSFVLTGCQIKQPTQKETESDTTHVSNPIFRFWNQNKKKEEINPGEGTLEQPFTTKIPADFQVATYKIDSSGLDPYEGTLEIKFLEIYEDDRAEEMVVGPELSEELKWLVLEITATFQTDERNASYFMGNFHVVDRQGQNIYNQIYGGVPDKSAIVTEEMTSGDQLEGAYAIAVPKDDQFILEFSTRNGRVVYFDLER